MHIVRGSVDLMPKIMMMIIYVFWRTTSQIQFLQLNQVHSRTRVPRRELYRTVSYRIVLCLRLPRSSSDDQRRRRITRQHLGRRRQVEGPRVSGYRGTCSACHVVQGRRGSGSRRPVERAGAVERTPTGDQRSSGRPCRTVPLARKERRRASRPPIHTTCPRLIRCIHRYLWAKGVGIGLGKKVTGLASSRGTAA